MGAKKDRSKSLVYEGNQSARRVLVNDETVTIPAGAAAALVNFQIQVFPIRSANGGSIGSLDDTSLVLTSTAFLNEVAFNTPDADLANGDYWVNYMSGECRGRKADGSVSMTVDYYVMLQFNQDASGNLSVTYANADATSQTGSFTGAGQIIGPFDVSQLRHVQFQLYGTFSLTWIAEVSANGNDWESLYMHQESQLSTIWQSGSAGAGSRMLNANISTGFIRFRCSAYMSGTGSVQILLFPSAAPTNTQNTIAYVQGYVATDGAAGGNPVLNGGRASNVERTAMSADGDVVEHWLDRRGRMITKRMDKVVRITTNTTTVVSNAIGALGKVIVTAALTGAVTIYNNTSPAGTIIQVLPIGFIGTFEADCLMDTGITIVTAAADQLTVTYTN